jgi:hypothetical protein
MRRSSPRIVCSTWATAAALILVVIGVTVGCSGGSASSCTLATGSGNPLEFRADSGKLDVSQSHDGENSDLTSMGIADAQKGALLLNSDQPTATMTIIGPPEATRFRVTGNADVIPEHCDLPAIAIARVTVVRGTNVTVDAADASDRQLFRLSPVIPETGSHLIAQIGTPQTVQP